tara:strand:+ start:1105 stop:1851 length:747 start_codon:yes stop_codon:yes gene_type:complete
MKYVFITGMGRSGTKFLSGLLSLDTGINVFHEEIGNREYWLLSWYLGESYQLPFLNLAKKKLEQSKVPSTIVDVNSYLQNSVESLEKVFLNSEVLHLVRDPRKVIPSIYTRRDDNRVHKIPKDSDEISNWLQMNKLQQVCYNWVHTTNSLIDSGTKLIKFEDVTSDYNYLKNHVLEIVGANISQEQFENFRKIKVNRTKSWLYRYLYAKYKSKTFVNENANFVDFSDEEKKMFMDICGPTMLKLNYTK